jgi:XTP/dITP diphosphohydrolase
VKNILIATHNKAKLEELLMGAKNLENKGIKVFTLNDVGVENDPIETGITFEENAILKAKFYAEKTGLPTIADDGGLIIPYLNNEPGVKSKRWLGREATDQELINFALQQLSGQKNENRIAFLQTCLCYYNPQTKQTLTQLEKINGYIAEKASHRPTDGYPYRAIFIVKKFNKYYDELTEEEHQQVNHRLIALKRLVTKITKIQ